MMLQKIKYLYRRNLIVRFALYPVTALRRKWHAIRLNIIHGVIANMRTMLPPETTIKVNNFDGHFRIRTSSDLFSRCITDGGYETDLVDAITPHIDKQRDAIDIGANVGFYSVLMANLISDSCRVLAIEPSNYMLKLLKDNIELNSCGDKVIIYEGCAGNSEGEVTLNTIEGNEEYSSLGKVVHPSALDKKVISQQSKCTTLDTLVEKHSLRPGFIKIDVEGFEHMVIEGASSVLEKHRPVIFSELSDELLRSNGASSSQVYEMLVKLGYKVYDPLNIGQKAILSNYSDIICIPE